MKSIITKLSFSLLALVLPVITFAQAPRPGNQETGGVFINILEFVQKVMGYLMPIITGGLIILFGWNLIQFLMKKENIEDADKFKKAMINSLIALFLWFVLVSLINMVAKSFDLEVGEGVKNVTQVDFKALNP